LYRKSWSGRLLGSEGWLASFVADSCESIWVAVVVVHWLENAEFSGSLIVLVDIDSCESSICTVVTATSATPFG
jgi:hypothetical protein